MATATAPAEATALYRAILAEPDEDTPRLVYADWLDENGDASDRTFAEFIRVECQLARMNTWDDGYTAARVRHWRLSREVGTKWRQPPGGLAGVPEPPDDLFTPSRGFAGKVKILVKPLRRTRRATGSRADRSRGPNST